MSPAVAPPPPAPAAERPAAPPLAGAAPPRPLPGFLDQIHWTPPAPGAARPLVAVLDTGVDARATGLAGVVVPGRSFVPGSPDPARDEDGHGTHVAGLIAAVAGGGFADGGASAVRILPVTIADAQGRTTTTALVRGLRYATAAGARIVNISFGGRGHSDREQDAIDGAVRAGVLVVVAAGNTGGRAGPPEYPGAYRQVVAVGAVGDSGRPLPLSQRGPQVSVAAPGQDVPSLRPRGEGPPPARLVRRSGTSVATAIVAGVATRLMSQRPAVPAAQVRAIIEATAHDLPPSGADSATGAGLVDLAAALAAPTPPPEDPEPNDDTVLAASTRAVRLSGAPATAVVTGRVGSWRDPRDGFRVHLSAGDVVTVHLVAGAPGTLSLALWRPGTPRGRRDDAFDRRWQIAASQGTLPSDTIAAVVPRTGVHTIEVLGVPGETGYAPPVAYALTVDVQPFRPVLAGGRMARMGTG